jgi:hypothetical protein
LRIDAVEALREAGYVHATFDEFGGLQLAINPSSLDWEATIGLHSPISATRWQRAVQDPWDLNRLELLFTLHLSGWQRCALPAAPYGAGGEQVCVC